MEIKEEYKIKLTVSIFCIIGKFIFNYFYFEQSSLRYGFTDTDIQCIYIAIGIILFYKLLIWITDTVNRLSKQHNNEDYEQ